MRTRVVWLVVSVILLASCGVATEQPPGSTVPATTTPAPVIDPGTSWAAAIGQHPGEVLYAGPGGHGAQNLTDLDAKGSTIRCTDGASVGNLRLSNVSRLTVEGCQVHPADGVIGVYLINGGSDLTFTGITTVGGERGFLVQNDRIHPEAWTTRVMVQDSTFRTPQIDTVAIYGGDNIHLLRNHMVLDTTGCESEHRDGIQTNAVANSEIIGNLIENNGHKSVLVGDGETCPADSGSPGFLHGQGLVLTQAEVGKDRAENILIQDNTVINWFSGFPMLVDGARTSNVKFVDNHIGCSLRDEIKHTGTGDVTITGTTKAPC